MQLRKSFFKLGAMTSIVALLFIACKKEDSGKVEEIAGEGTVTASIKIDDGDAILFESIPVSDYANLKGASDAAIAYLKKNGNLSLFFTNDKNYQDDGPGIGISLIFHKVSGTGDFPLTELEIELDGNVTKGNLGRLVMPNITYEDIFGTGEYKGEMGSGNVKITSFTQDRIKGTFSASMHNMKGEKATLSNGQFDVPLVREK